MKIKKAKFRLNAIKKFRIYNRNIVKKWHFMKNKLKN